MVKQFKLGKHLFSIITYKVFKFEWHRDEAGWSLTLPGITIHHMTTQQLNQFAYDLANIDWSEENV